MSAITRSLGIPARLLVLVIAGGLTLGLLVSILLPIASSMGSVLKVNTSIPVQLSPLATPSKVYADNGSLIAVLQDSDYRRPVTLSEVSPIAVKAILDVEDRNFYSHGALDYSSILRAAKADLSGGGSLQGGSTITQQLIKQTVLTSQRTFARKIKEAILAIRLQKQMTKNQILERYLNTVYFGNGAYGIGAAANTYFNEPASQLDASQAALLAAMIENPGSYDPITHPENALLRRNVALNQMVANHDLSASQASAAMGETLPTELHPLQVPNTQPGQSTFLEEVINALENDPRLGATSEARYNAVFKGGLSIFTSLDPTMQAQANTAVSKGLPNTGGKFTAALVALDPTNGEVRALVPGNNSPTAGFDVITGLGGGGGRQPGSSFKLFTLLGAITSGYSINDTVDGSAPCYFSDPAQTKGKIPGVYEATNAEKVLGSDIMSLTTATVDSINCAYLRVGLDLGLPAVVNQAAVMGVTLPNPTFPSLVIGGEGVQPIQMAGAYATVAAGGLYHKPTFIDHVTDSQGKVLIPPPGPGAPVVSAQDVAVADSVLTQVVNSGTGTGAKLAGRPAAGKTGTTDNYTNAWFDGYTPQLATVVWMGDPKGSSSMQPPATQEIVYGGTYPATIWHDFMTAALAGKPVLQFPSVPAGAIGPGKYLNPPGPPFTDVSGKYGQGVPTNVAPPAPTKTVCTPVTTPSSASTGPGAVPGSSTTPATTCKTVPVTTTTSSTSTTVPTSTTTTTYASPPPCSPTGLPGYPPCTIPTVPLSPGTTATTFPGFPSGTTPPTGLGSGTPTSTTPASVSGQTCTSTSSGIYCNGASAANPAAGGG
ncbi:MAG: transglycosylase domain-containing protein [Acidimicrobiales bacterium]